MTTLTNKQQWALLNRFAETKWRQGAKSFERIDGAVKAIVIDGETYTINHIVAAMNQACGQIRFQI